MSLSQTSQHAHEHLSRQFGPEWEAPYFQGKVEMANWLVGSIHVSQDEAMRVLQELEHIGAMRFQANVRNTSPRSKTVGREVWSRAKTPTAEKPGTETHANEMGTWVFEGSI